MAEIRREGETIFVGDRVAIERGPARKTATANDEILADAVTATHYHAPRPATEAEIADPTIATDDQGVRFAVDAAGKRIELGKRFTFLDYLGEHGFYVMELAERPGYDPEKHTEREIWQERGFVPDGEDARVAEIEAINQATKIAG